MNDSASTDSPLEAAAGAAGPRAIEAFSILGNETRLSIMLALWEAYEPWAEDNAVPFTELRDRVGMRDSGQFNYHLDKLAGHYVEKTDNGYELRTAGHQLVRTVIAGIGIEEPTFEPAEIEHDCPLCNAPTVINYADRLLYIACTECEGTYGGEDRPSGLLYRVYFDPAGLKDRTPDQVWTANHVRSRKRLLSMIEGVCPECSGPTDISLDICEKHVSNGVCEKCGKVTALATHVECTICKSSGWFPPFWGASLHPSVLTFFNERGVPFLYDVSSLGSNPGWGGLVGEYDQELVSEEPPRVQVSYQYEGDRLEVLVDEEMNVLEVTEPD